MKLLTLRSTVALCGILLLFGCDAPTALITCGNVETLKTSFGYVDNAQIGLGNLFIIDTVHKNLAGWKHLQYNSADINTGARTNNDIDIEAGFNVNVSGKLPNTADSARIAVAISKSMKFHLVNYQRLEFINADSVIHESVNSGILQECKNPSNQGKILGFVATVIQGDSSLIYLNKIRAVNVNANVGTYVGITVSVTYNCSGNFEKTGVGGKPTEFFYKPQYYVCDTVKGLINITGTVDFDLTKFKQNTELLELK